jgi:serine/threonine protein kinase
VLLYSLEQTPAIDVWSAGVVLLSLLTRRYPFFQTGSDRSDETSLLQIAGLLGASNLRAAAESLHRRLELPDDKELAWSGGAGATGGTDGRSMGSLFHAAFQSPPPPPRKQPGQEETTDDDDDDDDPRVPPRVPPRARGQQQLHAQAVDLALRMLELMPTKRATAAEARAHPLVTGAAARC